MAGLIEADPDGWREVYTNLKQADKTIQRALRKRLAEAGKPAAQDVIDEASAQLPARGGLSRWVGASKPSLSMSATRLAIKIGRGNAGRRRSDINAMNRGRLRHPVYGNRRSWVTQSIPAGLFERAWERQADRVVEDVAVVLDDIITDLL